MTKEFFQTKEWVEIETILKESIIDKPLNISVSGKTADMIALEVMASSIAAKKIKSAIRKIKSLSPLPKKDDTPYY